MQKNYLYEFRKYFRNRTWNRVISFWLTLIMISFVSILVRAENESQPKPEPLTQLEKSFSTNNIYDIGSLFTYEETGKASWYGKRFHKRKTSSGERYDMYGYTAAHKTLPFGTILRVTNFENNKSVLVRINDRGPFVRSKVIDLSYQSMKEITDKSLGEVRYEGLQLNPADSLDNIAGNYMFCYSLDRPLACYPVSILSVIDSTSDFDAAMQIYSDLSRINPYSAYYISIQANWELTGKNTQFYVSLLPASQRKDKPEKDLTFN